MAEQTFKSPGFFEREIEVVSRPLFRNTATPAAVIGTASRGPAFVPTTVSSRREFIRLFGNPDRNRLGAHAVHEFFANNGKALTYCRVLGSGIKKLTNGSVENAGFEVTSRHGGANHGGNGVNANRVAGTVNFIVGNHTLSKVEHIGYGQFSDNSSHTLAFDTAFANKAIDAVGGGDLTAQLVRAMIITHKDYVVRVLAAGHNLVGNNDTQDNVAVNQDGIFLISFQKADESVATDPVPVSLDPSRADYISNVLNTNPFDIENKKHFLYAHFPVDSAIASVANGSNIACLTGHDEAFSGHYGNFKSPFTTAKTTSFISQPFGNKEYDLFRFEALDDGEYANNKYKISISGLTASTDPKDNFGTFDVVVRDLRDTDESPVVYESFKRCSLNPDADNFIAKIIGDSKLNLRLDVVSDDEKRLIREGSFPNNSDRVRVIVSDDVLRREIPENSLPFGFRGIPSLRTTSDNNDGGATNTSFLKGLRASVGDLAAGDDAQVTGANENKLGFSIVPPVPYRFKVTKGDIRDITAVYRQTFLGQASVSESLSTALHWGCLTTRVEDINKVNDAPSKLFNEIFVNYNKLLSNSSAAIASDESADSFNNNKFSLAKVALAAGASAPSNVSISDVSGTLSDVFKEAVYIRNADANSGLWDSATGTIKLDVSGNDPFGNDANVKSYRASLAKLLAEDKKKFNKYNEMAKFTAPFYGGFDGLNITDRDDYYLTDRSASIDAGGHAGDGGYESALLNTSDGSMNGTELENNAIVSYNNAIRVMTDDMVVNHNILVVPGIRDTLVTDFAARRTAAYGKALYVMDIPHYTSGASSTRIFVSSNGLASGRPDAEATASSYDIRQLNNSYVATYFPDVYIEDSGDDEDAAVASRRSVRVPSSIVALGALAKNDSILSPWFAPAGFNRGSLESIRATDVRLNTEDRDTLYEARINPIANFPNNQFVIFGQKTAQLAKTALDRVNVRRLVLEIKRRLETIAQQLLFEQNNQATRTRFITQASTQLSNIQVAQGIEDFRVVMDGTNNSQEDVDNNRLNGRIVFVPTRAVEFIAIDFIITNSGVEYPS
jgi:hypothetical protein